MPADGFAAASVLPGAAHGATLELPRAGPVPRWQLPAFDARPQEPEPAEGASAAPSSEELLAQRVAQLEAELAALHASVAAAREAAAAEGRAAGHDEGRAAGRAAADAAAEAHRAGLTRAWKAVEAQVLARLGALDEALDQGIHDLVVALGATVLRAELAISGAPLRRLIEDALVGMREELAAASVVLNPEDLALLGDMGIPALSDAGLARGDVRIRTAHGEIEASVRDRVAVAIAELARNA